jgi:alpha-1,6-mannosyltransferase
VTRITGLGWTGLGWTGLGWPLLALVACLLALSVAGAIWITHFDDANVGFVMLLQAAPYALGAWLVVSGRAKGADGGRALATILIVGLAMRLVLLPGWPVSTDVCRYVWDGRVQGAGINPYRETRYRVLQYDE